jgi:hypothetical protein
MAVGMGGDGFVNGCLGLNGCGCGYVNGCVNEWVGAETGMN